MYRFLSLILYFVLSALSFTAFQEVFAKDFQPEPVKFVVFSPPKCGTHLVAKVISLMLQCEPTYHLQSLGASEEFLRKCEDAYERNSFVISHNLDKETVSSLLRQGYKIIFTLRDPRDQLISMADWMQEGQWDWFPVAKMENIEAKITELITGKRYKFRSYENCMGKSVKLLTKLPESQCYTTRFESLVGPEGGGDAADQLQEILNIAAFLEINIGIDTAEELAGKIFGGTSTFRKGQIGVWKERLTEEQKRTYKRLYGRTLIKLGYEKGMSW